MRMRLIVEEEVVNGELCRRVTLMRSVRRRDGTVIETEAANLGNLSNLEIENVRKVIQANEEGGKLMVAESDGE